ncbi:MAG: DUF748 domain-containing protein [Candidatus Marinarcus sp.]|uniref:DUF748 domain-containing protein n=1 Tax=Candidatus Marinarcus sp. TaxID=3100987 RepID=UPI003B00AAF7
MKKRTIYEKIGIALAAFFLFYLILGFLIIPYIIKSQAINFAKTHLEKNLTIDSVRFNPLTFELNVNDLTLKEKDLPLIAFHNLSLDFDLLRTIANGYLHFNHFNIIQPKINAIIAQNKTFNLMSLKPKSNPSEVKDNPTTPVELIKLQLDRLAIVDGEVTFEDLSQDVPFHFSLHKLNYTFRDLSTLKNSVASNNFDSTLNDKTNIHLEGGIYLNPLKVYGNFTIKDFYTKDIWNTVKKNYDFDINEDLTLQTKIGFFVDLEKELSIKINDASFALNDVSIKEKTTQNQILALNTFKIENFNLTWPNPTHPINTDLNLYINSGKIAAQAQIDTNKSTLEAECHIETLPLTVLNNILASLSHIQIKTATLDAQANIKMDEKSNIFVNANTQINNIDIQNKNVSIIKAKELALEKIEYNKDNNSLFINGIELISPYAFVQINKKSQLNLSKLAKKQKKSKTKKEKNRSSPLLINVDAVEINHGSMTFEDMTLPIPFKTYSKNLKGKFSKYNSRSTKPSTIKLEGSVGQYGYMKIEGKVSYNNIKDRTDIAVVFNNVAMRDLTSYSGKFIGRKIDDGKLSLNLMYDLKDAQLNAKNNILLEKFKLGEKIESKDAVNLPLDLAIAILEDSNGVIDIKLPITGNLDNPQFSIAPIVWKAFTNLMIKAITAPFSLLGSLFGFGEDEINNVKFSFGNDAITPVQKEPLDKVSQILKEREKLAIELTPTVDAKNDLYALQKVAFKEFIDKKMGKVSDKKYKKVYLEMLENLYETYQLSLKELKKEVTINNEFDANAYLTQLEERVIQKHIIEKTALETLAQNRIKNIQNYLIHTQKVNPKQIVLLKKIEEDSTNENFSVMQLKLKNIKE